MADLMKNVYVFKHQNDCEFQIVFENSFAKLIQKICSPTKAATFWPTQDYAADESFLFSVQNVQVRPLYFIIITWLDTTIDVKSIIPACFKSYEILSLTYLLKLLSHQIDCNN